ncbi:MAG: hypothetical protein E6R03_02200 [Hyphomicrobiaceae bacterium]|nr:MAG: hypothetical protein E6R03_02200 [Hyphomicrobiaceae bacterium]
MATKIPEGPWTVERLGEELYVKLALEYGCFDPRRETFRPALDLTAPYNDQGQAPSQPAAKATKE